MARMHASKLIAGGRGLAQALLRRAAVLALDWDTRQKSRFEAVDASGRRIGVFLPRGATVRGGDVLVAEDGGLIVVEALAQPVIVVTARAASRDRGLDLLRAAYHLGNRHVPLEGRGDRLVLEPDHVLAEMLVRMGLDVAETRSPFEPEAGAYDASSGHHHGRDHGDGPDHRHDRGDCDGHDHGAKEQ